MISVNALSSEKTCSKFSYIRNTQNNENAKVAYSSFLRPLLKYAKIDSPAKIPDNIEPAVYNSASISSFIAISCIGANICIGININTPRQIRV